MTSLKFTLAFLLLALLPLSALAQPIVKAATGTIAAPVFLAARAPAPSRRMGKRSTRQKPIQAKKPDFSTFLCPADLPLACPNKEVKSSDLRTLASWFSVGFQCVDSKVDLKSCGGCVFSGTGQDCTAITNAEEVGCDEGRCVVSSCAQGYVLGRDNKSCMKKADENTMVANTGSSRRGLTRNPQR